MTNDTKSPAMNTASPTACYYCGAITECEVDCIERIEREEKAKRPAPKVCQGSATSGEAVKPWRKRLVDGCFVAPENPGFAFTGASAALAARDAEIADLRAALAASAEPKPIPTTLHCPDCGALHVDEGEWATRAHKTHQCQACKHEWRPFAWPTVGVAASAEQSNSAGSARQGGNTCEYKPYCAYCDEDRDEPCSAPSCGVAGDFAPVAERAAAIEIDGRTYTAAELKGRIQQLDAEAEAVSQQHAAGAKRIEELETLLAERAAAPASETAPVLDLILAYGAAYHCMDDRADTILDAIKTQLARHVVLEEIAKLASQAIERCEEDGGWVMVALADYKALFDSLAELELIEGTRSPSVPEGYTAMRKALERIAQPANAHCGCDFPCRCDCPEAEEINAEAMRDIASVALSAVLEVAQPAASSNNSPVGAHERKAS